MRRYLTGLLCLLLIGCGGGGSGGGSNIGGGATVPDVLGQTQAAATTAITGAGLMVGIVTPASSLTVPDGDVISQNPIGGTSAVTGSSVDLVVSSGPGGGGAFSLEEPFPHLPNFDNPIFFAAVPLPDTRFVVVEQSGHVKVFTPTASVSTTSVILDISSLIIVQGEQGLLGFAFDPNFNTNDFIYVYYTRRGDGAIVVARYTWDPATATANSPKIILTVDHSGSANHNGGMIAFGPDGFLYIALGDGGGNDDTFNNGQNLNSLLAKILRIDVHPANPANAYEVPANNPFFNMAGRRGETWAFGLRNPFRFSFDRLTGQLWVGDVGQGAWEEIDNATVGGLNFGWPRFEGNHLNPNGNVALVPGTQHTPPIKEYDHSLGFAIIGGYVYRGSMASLDGKYVYTDYGSGTVWAMNTSGQNNVVLTSAPNPTSFGEDNDGEIYIVTQNGWLFRLTDGTVGGP